MIDYYLDKLSNKIANYIKIINNWTKLLLVPRRTVEQVGSLLYKISNISIQNYLPLSSVGVNLNEMETLEVTEGQWPRFPAAYAR